MRVGAAPPKAIAFFIMKTIRNLLDSLVSEIDYLKEENPNADTTDLKKYADEIEGVIDDLESNNTDIKDVVSSINDVPYLSDLVSDLETPVQQNAKLLY